MTEPIASRVRLPADYGLSEDWPLLAWSVVDQRLAAALQYWITTADAAGTPIARPIDGMWLDTSLYFSSHPDVRWRRNLKANPRACVTLEDAECPVILEGLVTQTTPNDALAETLAEQANAKYDWSNQTADAYRVVICVFTPSKAMTWNTLFENATRFRFR